MRLACRKMPKMREVLSIVHLASAVAKSKHLFVASPLSMMSFSFHPGKSFFESIYPCFFCFCFFYFPPPNISWKLIINWECRPSLSVFSFFSLFCCRVFFGSLVTHDEEDATLRVGHARKSANENKRKTKSMSSSAQWDWFLFSR